MNDRAPPPFFDREHAAVYDRQFEPVAAMREALHLFTRLVLTDLPSDARILCVGVGTGLELVALADVFPGWRFTAVEPSGPMLDQCRAKVEALGLSDRCTLHEAYVDELPPTDPFDAATALLVSHFLTDDDERRAFYRAIADRLTPGGLFVNADISRAPRPEVDAELRRGWTNMFRLVGAAEEKIKANLDTLDEKVGVRTAEQIEAMLASAGFAGAAQFYQALLVRAWVARRA